MTLRAINLHPIANGKVAIGSLILLGLLSSSFAMAAALSVTLPSKKTALNYAHPMRLDQVYTDVINNSHAISPTEYPIANQLFNLDKSHQSEQLKQQVVEQLEVQFGDGKNRTSAQLLINQIESWEIGYREHVDLDFDLIRTQAGANPMLSGHYEFITVKRSPQIQIEGLVFQPQTLEFKSDMSLSAYINQAKTLSSAHSSYAWVIYPDGHAVRAGYALWNNQDIQLTPNSVIFLGFNSDAEASLALEEKIVKLIAMRKHHK